MSASRRRDAEDQRDDHGMPNEAVGFLALARAKRAGNRREDAAAHSAGRDHLHQHQKREDEGDAGQRVGAELGDEIGLD